MLFSRLRIITILVIVLMLLGISIIPFAFFVTPIGNINTRNSQGEVVWQTAIAAFFFLFVLVYFIYKIIFRTLIIKFNDENKTIEFHYPFRFLKINYTFEQIEAIRFSVVYSKICDFKCLILKTNDDKIYKVTDFEISNFTEIEKTALLNFKLTKGDNFKSLNKQEKEAEIEKNKIFDTRQAIEYRFSCYLFLGLIIAAIFIDRYIAVSERKLGWVGYTLFLVLSILLIYKIRQANKIIKGQ